MSPEMEVDMYQLLLILQYIGILFFILDIFFILRQQKTRIQTLLLIMCISGLINMVGYLFEMKAKDLNTAIMSVKLLYIGKPFIVLMMFLVILEYFGISFKKWKEYVLIGIHVFVSVSVFLCDSLPLFYTSIDFTEEGLFPHLILGRGIFYLVYTAGILLYVAVMIFVLFREEKKAKDRKQRTQIHVFFVMVFVCVFAMLLFLSGVTKGYDTTAIAYLICTILLSLSLHRYNLLDPIGIVKETVIDQLEDGIIAIGENGELILHNEIAVQLIAEVREKNKGLTEQEAIAKLCTEGVYQSSTKVYEVAKNRIEKRGIFLGDLFILKDITERYHYAHQLEWEVAQKTVNLKLMQHRVTLGLAETIESRDRDTGGHVRRTSDVIRIFAEKLGSPEMGGKYSGEFLERVINSAPMHDLGKIGVEDAVLNKPGRFTPDDYDKMKTHAKKGAIIIERILGGTDDKEFLKIAINMAHYHHERYDGTGYPCGKKGEEIPVEARIMALADVFDALVSRRCYKEQMSFDEAFDIIEKSLGTHFDEELGRCFISCREELVQYYTEADRLWAV